MGDNELISIILCVYKEPIEWIKNAVYSIINQTYTNLEIIIVIDNPDHDKAIQFIKNLKLKKLQYCVNSQNQGLVKSLNIALAMCKGKYVARMDADDYSYPQRLKLEYQYLKDNKLDIVGTAYEIVEGNEIISVRYNPKNSFISKKVLRYKNCIVHPTWLVRTEVFSRLKGYREIDACEDYDFLVRASLEGYRIGSIDQVLFQYRINENSISHTKRIKQELTMNYISSFYRKQQVMKEWIYKDYVATPQFICDLRKIQERYHVEDEINKEKNPTKRSIKVIKAMFVNREYRKEKVKNQIVKSLFLLDQII